MDKKIERELIADMEHSKGVTFWVFIFILEVITGIILLAYYHPKILYSLLVLIPFIACWLCWEWLIKLAKRNGHTQFRKYEKL
jgi:hypothetical protein